ncbi:PREDICTED: pentatricopeptide repeat-containing protein At4g32430, mitochondrial-like [Camelina sativa]|uniref:Pentatricopeptide repeat-containing protein At4g32430, mitochondrial-like n=1 Tax=Camelina sativa TaxID=90675 RepID=A0ABM1QHG1_CAMSA|nr:PREDICTED: pentatricopeptide repeat-containing protein At4g32430, mitochondrial-like [Camelina sativa]
MSWRLETRLSNPRVLHNFWVYFLCLCSKRFNEMKSNGVVFDAFTYSTALSYCVGSEGFRLGLQLQSTVVRSGLESDLVVGNSFITMYSRSGSFRGARRVFDEMPLKDMISWNSLLSGLSQIKDGLNIHGLCIKTGFVSEPSVGNSFITMYAKFDALEDAKKAFDDITFREIISWNAMISGFAQNGFSHEALKMFLLAAAETMPNEYTFGSVLNAIAFAEDISVKHGQRCHAHLLKLGLNSCPVVSSALLDMYAKRGNINESEKVFTEMSQRNQFVWTSIISAYSSHGDFDSVMNLFHQMRKENVAPDLVTFLSVLTACNRKGMVDKGYEIFNMMIQDYNLEPCHEHYSCMVDLLGRAGRLKEAEELMSEVPGGPGESMLQSMLGSCRLHGNVTMGAKVAELAMELKPELSGSYVQMYNIYAEKEQWDKAAEIRRTMRKKNVSKEAGFSWIDVGDTEGSLTMQGFSSGDKSHPKSDEIYSMVGIIGLEMNLEVKVAV